MRISPLLVALVLPAGLNAQARHSVYLRAGASWSSDLVTDKIVSDNITVQPDVAPAILVGGQIEAFPRYNVDLEAQFTSGSYSAATSGRGTTDLATLRTLSVSVGFNGPLIGPWTRWRASVGFLDYLPREKQGIFLQGGPLDATVGAGLDYRRPVSSRFDILVSLRYDYHRFITDELQSQGFSQTQQVHRVGLTIGIATGGRP